MIKPNQRRSDANPKISRFREGGRIQKLYQGGQKFELFPIWDQPHDPRFGKGVACLAS